MKHIPSFHTSHFNRELKFLNMATHPLGTSKKRISPLVALLQVQRTTFKPLYSSWPRRIAGTKGWTSLTLITLGLSLSLVQAQNVAVGTAGVAFDADGNEYFGTYASGFILSKMSRSGVTQSLGTVVPNLAGQPITPSAFAIAVNGVGDVFYTAPKIISSDGTLSQPGRIWKINGATGAAGVIVDNLNAPAGLAIDGSGNLYYGDYSEGFNLFKLSATGVESLGQIVPPLRLITRYVFTLAADGAGNVYYTTPSLSGTPGSINVIGKSSGIVVGGLTSPAGLACDSVGNLYFGDYNDGWVVYMRSPGGAVQSFGVKATEPPIITPYAFSLAVPPQLDYFGIGVNWSLSSHDNMRDVRGDLDAMNLGVQLRASLPNRLGQSTVVPLYSTETGQDNLNTIATQFGQFVPSARAIDTVLFYTSSHGNPYPPGGPLVQFEIDIADDYVTNPSLEDTTIATLLGQLPKVTRKVVIMDACHSGGIGDYLCSVLANTTILAASTASGTTVSEPSGIGKDGEGVFTDDLIVYLSAGVFDLNQLAYDIGTDPELNIDLIGKDLDLRDSGSSLFTALQPALYESVGTPGRIMGSSLNPTAASSFSLQARIADPAILITVGLSLDVTNAVALEVSTDLRSWFQVGFEPSGTGNVVFTVPKTNYVAAFFRGKLVD